MLPAAKKSPVFFLFFLGYLTGLCQTSTAAQASSSPIGEIDSYFKVIWGLLVVLAIILVLYALLRKRFSLLASRPEQNIKILEIKSLMGKKALCLISVHGNEYLLGISGDRISHLATLPDKTDHSFAATLRATETDQP